MSVTANNSLVFDDEGNAYFNDLSYSGTATQYGYSGPTNYGYGQTQIPSTGGGQNIQRFPFALSITNAANVGEDFANDDKRAANSSKEHGYFSGGANTTKINIIDRFPFALAITNGSDVGDLTVARGYRPAGASTITNGYGYTMAGENSSSNEINVIDRFPFALSITNATDVGDTSLNVRAVSGCQSSTHGYVGGGRNLTLAVVYNVLERFPFALSITNTTDVGDLTLAKNDHAGVSSTDFGYTIGGAPGNINVIDRFPFALSITNATDVGDLSIGRESLGGTFSTTHGYALGGNAAVDNTIDRFPFALSITNATDVGDFIDTSFLDVAGTQF